MSDLSHLLKRNKAAASPEAKAKRRQSWKKKYVSNQPDSKSCLWCKKVFHRGNTANRPWGHKVHCSRSCTQHTEQARRKLYREALNEKRNAVFSPLTNAGDKFLYTYKPVNAVCGEAR